jgi:hypothetical protein
MRKKKASAESARPAPPEVRAPEGLIAFMCERLPLLSKSHGACLFYTHSLMDVFGFPPPSAMRVDTTNIPAECYCHTSKRPGPTQPGIAAGVATSAMTSYSIFCTQLN